MTGDPRLRLHRVRFMAPLLSAGICTRVADRVWKKFILEEGSAW